MGTTAKGHNGTVTLNGPFLTINRTGFLARASVGKGSKTIPVDKITAVQHKPAGWLVNGYIEFSVSGGNEGRARFGHQTAHAGLNENAVIYTYSQRHEFEVLRTAVQDAMATSYVR